MEHQPSNLTQVSTSSPAFVDALSTSAHGTHWRERVLTFPSSDGDSDSDSNSDSSASSDAESAGGGTGACEDDAVVSAHAARCFSRVVQTVDATRDAGSGAAPTVPQSMKKCSWHSARRTLERVLSPDATLGLLQHAQVRALVRPVHTAAAVALDISERWRDWHAAVAIDEQPAASPRCSPGRSARASSDSDGSDGFDSDGVAGGAASRWKPREPQVHAARRARDAALWANAALRYPSLHDTWFRDAQQAYIGTSAAHEVMASEGACDESASARAAIAVLEALLGTAKPAHEAAAHALARPHVARLALRGSAPSSLLVLAVREWMRSTLESSRSVMLRPCAGAALVSDPCVHDKCVAEASAWRAWTDASSVVQESVDRRCSVPAVLLHACLEDVRDAHVAEAMVRDPQQEPLQAQRPRLPGGLGVLELNRLLPDGVRGGLPRDMLDADAFVGPAGKPQDQASQLEGAWEVYPRGFDSESEHCRRWASRMLYSARASAAAPEHIGINGHVLSDEGGLLVRVAGRGIAPAQLRAGESDGDEGVRAAGSAIFVALSTVPSGSRSSSQSRSARVATASTNGEVLCKLRVLELRLLSEPAERASDVGADAERWSLVELGSMTARAPNQPDWLDAVFLGAGSRKQAAARAPPSGGEARDPDVVVFFGSVQGGERSVADDSTWMQHVGIALDADVPQDAGARATQVRFVPLPHTPPRGHAQAVGKENEASGVASCSAAPSQDSERAGDEDVEDAESVDALDAAFYGRFDETAGSSDSAVVGNCASWRTGAQRTVAHADEDRRLEPVATVFLQRRAVFSLRESSWSAVWLGGAVAGDIVRDVYADFNLALQDSRCVGMAWTRAGYAACILEAQSAAPCTALVVAPLGTFLQRGHGVPAAHAVSIAPAF